MVLVRILAFILIAGIVIGIGVVVNNRTSKKNPLKDENDKMSLDEINNSIDSLLKELSDLEFEALGGIKEHEEKIKLIKSQIKLLQKLKTKKSK